MTDQAPAQDELTGSPSDFPTNKFPWEDTLILGFRDIQWRKSLAAWFSERQARKSPFASDEFETEFPKMMPPPIFKFDGDAERLGDVLTANSVGKNAKFFLFEFKRDRNAIYSEWADSQKHSKWLALFMKRLACKLNHASNVSDAEDKKLLYQKILYTSARGHFLAYGETQAVGKLQANIPVLAQPYVQAIGRHSGVKNATGKKRYKLDFMPKEAWIRPIEEVIGGACKIELSDSTPTPGLSLEEMGEYMGWLSSGVGGEVTAALLDEAGRLVMRLWRTSEFALVAKALLEHRQKLANIPTPRGSSSAGWTADREAARVAKKLCEWADAVYESERAEKSKDATK